MEEDIKEINNLSPVEWAMRELRESYELKHRDWASNCLNIIKEELDNCIPISVIQNKIDEIAKEYRKILCKEGMSAEKFDKLNRLEIETETLEDLIEERNK